MISLIVTTDDGSYGVHGFVSTVLQEMIDKGEKIDRVFAIGPVPMMRVLSDVTRPHGIKTIVSLNPIMVDATGMCGACRVAVGGKQNLPVWMGRNLMAMKWILSFLSSRLKMYCDQEKSGLRKAQVWMRWKLKTKRKKGKSAAAENAGARSRKRSMQL